MKKIVIIFGFTILFGGDFSCAAAPGGITVGGTRLIYDGAKKESSLNITNTDTNPYLIQSWIESDQDSSEKAPFIATPPLFRLEANQQNLLRVVRTAKNLPEDRESLYWMDIKSIPSANTKEGINTLQIAVKTRIKLLYRPQGLQGMPEDVTHKLIWTLDGSFLTVNNPTPFVMNFQQVRIGGKNVNEVTYALPMKKTTFSVPNDVKGPISWRLISDYGGVGPEHTSSH